MTYNHQWIIGVLALLIALVLVGPTEAQECANPKPEWIFCEDFEGSSFLANWQEVSHTNRKVRETNSSKIFQGDASLKLVFPPGDVDGGGWMHFWWQPSAGQNEMYLRYYVRYSTGFRYGNWDVKLAGLEAHLPGVRYRPGAGNVPDGTWFQSRGISLGVSDSRGPEGPKEPFLYYYHPDQKTNFGDFGYQNRTPRVALEDERWYCIEIMLKPNTVVRNSNGSYSGNFDGEQVLWIDGAEKARYSGIRWRTFPDVLINDLYQSAWIGQPTATSEQYRWEDNYIISKNRIGCIDDTPPNPPTGLTVK